MSHGSLVGFEEHDPVEEVLFYSKGSPVKVLSKEQVNSRVRNEFVLFHVQ